MAPAPVTLDDQTAIGIVAGSAVTFLVAAVFYWLSGRQLRREAGRLRHLVNMILVGLQNTVGVDVSYDDKGEPVGINVTVHPETIRNVATVLPATPATESPPPDDDPEDPAPKRGSVKPQDRLRGSP